MMMVFHSYSFSALRRASRSQIHAWQSPPSSSPSSWLLASSTICSMLAMSSATLLAVLRFSFLRLLIYLRCSSVRLAFLLRAASSSKYCTRSSSPRLYTTWSLPGSLQPWYRTVYFKYPRFCTGGSASTEWLTTTPMSAHCLTSRLLWIATTSSVAAEKDSFLCTRSPLSLALA